MRRREKSSKGRVEGGAGLVKPRVPDEGAGGGRLALLEDAAKGWEWVKTT